MLAKVYPPAGYFISPLRLIVALLSSDIVSNCYLGSDVYTYDSGKSSLLQVCKAMYQMGLRKPVAVSAYTCPDVISSIKEAGLKIKLIDVEPGDSRICVTYEKVQDCSAVLLSNLYGAKDLCSDVKDVIVIDDLCQAGLNSPSLSSPMHQNYVQVYSFGRGKAFSGAGGGMLVLPKQNNDLSEYIKQANTNISQTSFVEIAAHIQKALLMWLCQDPRMYALIASLSFLRLGETKVISNINAKVAFPMMEKLFYAYKLYSESTRKEREEKVNAYRSSFMNYADVTDYLNAYDGEFIRYPILWKDESKRNLFFERHNAKGLSKSYNSIVLDLFPKSDFVNADDMFPHARFFSKNVLTFSLAERIRIRDIGAFFSDSSINYNAG